MNAATLRTPEHWCKISLNAPRRVGGGGVSPPFFVPRELAYPAHHMVLDTRSRKQGSELSGATMIPQMTAVADLTRSEDLLSLKPGYAVGDCHAHRRPSVHEAQ